MLVSCGVLVGISYLMLDVLSGMVVNPKTPVREIADEGELVLPLPGKRVTSMQVSRDGSFMAYEGSDVEGGQATLSVVELKPGLPVVFSRNVKGEKLAWLGDGNVLVYEDGGDIQSLDVERGTQKNLTGSAEPDRDPLPSSDGRYILWTRYTSSTGSPEAELWVMDSDGDDKIIMAGQADLATWDPAAGKVMSRRRVNASSADETYRYFLQTAVPGGERWEFYTECEGEVRFIWWPRQEEIYYISPQLVQDKVKGVLFKVDTSDPTVLTKVASMDSLGDDRSYYRFYPSRVGERLAYVGEKGLEYLDVEEKIIYRFSAPGPEVPLAWNEVGGEIYYHGPEGIYRVSIGGE